MNCYNENIKLDAFQEKTTYLNDYKKYCSNDIQQKSFTKLIKRPQKEPSINNKPPSERKYEDHETFAKWKKGVYIPFDLLLDPKEIIQTNPRKPFVKLTPLPDNDKIQAIKTRPRIIMAPACSMDDVPDPEIRKLLCDFMYTTEWRKAELEGSSEFQAKIPNIEKIQPGNAVTLQTDLYPPLKETFLRKGKEWDDQQRRGAADPTKDFWIHKEPPVVCGACVNPLDNLVPEETKQEIRDAIKRDRLRIAHDLTSPSYCGYKPRLPDGVPISRKKLDITHPMLTVSQAITARYGTKKT